MSVTDKLLYTQVLDEKLSHLSPPDSLHSLHCQHQGHSVDREKHIIDILYAMIESIYECISLSGKPSKSDSRWQPLPGWNEHVAQLKRDSLFWHSVWISADRPVTGLLYQVMLHARLKYHTAVKKAKRLADFMKAESLLEAPVKSDYALMEELKKTLGSKSRVQTVPESLDGKVTHDSTGCPAKLFTIFILQLLSS